MFFRFVYLQRVLTALLDDFIIHLLTSIVQLYNKHRLHVPYQIWHLKVIVRLRRWTYSIIILYQSLSFSRYSAFYDSSLMTLNHLLGYYRRSPASKRWRVCICSFLLVSGCNLWNSCFDVGLIERSGQTDRQRHVHLQLHYAFRRYSAERLTAIVDVGLQRRRSWR